MARGRKVSLHHGPSVYELGKARAVLTPRAAARPWHLVFRLDVVAFGAPIVVVVYRPITRLLGMERGYLCHDCLHYLWTQGLTESIDSVTYMPVGMGISLNPTAVDTSPWWLTMMT